MKIYARKPNPNLAHVLAIDSAHSTPGRDYTPAPGSPEPTGGGRGIYSDDEDGLSAAGSVRSGLSMINKCLMIKRYVRKSGFQLNCP